MRMTLRRFSSEKNEGFSLIGLPGNSSLRPMLCSVDRRSALAATDQPEGPASRCRDYQTRFVTTRTLSLSHRARRKPARLDSPGLGCVRSSRPKPRPRPFGLRAHIARRQVRNGGSSRPAPIALRVTPFRYRRVELQPALASVGFVKFALIPKNAGQVGLRRIRKRIRFYCLSSLLLGLIGFADVYNHSRQQIVRGRIRGRKFFSALQFAQTFGKFPFCEKANPTKGRVGLGQRRRDGDR